jgi:hypothetical protein
MRATTPARPESNSPSTEYRRHHPVEEPAINRREFRPGWQRRTRLMSLVKTGKIGRDELAAALLWRSWVEVVGQVRTQRFVARIDQTTPPGTPTQHELAAANALRAACTALGRAQTDLLLAVLVDDQAWARIARQTGVDRHTVVARTVRALAALARWRRRQPSDSRFSGGTKVPAALVPAARRPP